MIGDESIAQDSWGSPKARDLFFYLLANRSSQRKDAIIADLWPDLPIDSANNNFHSSVHRLRVATHPVIVVFKDGAYEVNSDVETWFDLAVFQDLLDQAEQLPRGSEERAQKLEDALELYTGPVLEEFYSEWTETLRRDAEAKYLRALGTLSGFYTAKRRFSQAIGVLERATKIDVLEERIRLELMQCFMREGDARAAIHTYMEYSHILADEVGEQPSPEMQKAYEEAVAKI